VNGLDPTLLAVVNFEPLGLVPDCSFRDILYVMPPG
jgi:hypothetical protein